MPRNTGHPYGAKFDFYHPSVYASLLPPNCGVGTLRVGVWDDSGTLDTVIVELDGSQVEQATSTSNGHLDVTLSPSSRDQVVRVEARDGADNRQAYEITVGQLVERCQSLPDGSTIFTSGIEDGPLEWSAFHVGVP